MSQIDLIIADDHPIFREGLQRILETEKSFNVLHVAKNGAEALEQAAAQKPDVMILDVSMPEMGGLEAAAKWQKEKLPFELVLLTMHDDRETLVRAIKLGVKGFVLKDDASDDIVRCVKSVIEGKNFVSSGMTHHLLQRPDEKSQNSSSENEPDLDQLTPAERRILKLIAKDMTSKEIASELGVSPRTIDNHRSNICGKLDLFGSHSLIRFALKYSDQL